MDTRLERIRNAAEYVGRICEEKKLAPKVGIVLGSGLGRLAEELQDATCIPFKDIPDFPISTAMGHKGNIIIGSLADKTVIAMQGRLHFYEGHAMESVTLPVRVLKLLGVRTLFVSNAAGGVNPDFRIGDLMIIRDHINLLPNPLIGPNLEEFGPRFPDMTRPYDLKLISLAKEVAAEEGINLREGVYLACSGPTFETPAEYRYMRNAGADAIGMSTTPEVIVARHCGIRVFGMSVITDVAHENPEDYVTEHEEIVRQADAAARKMSRLFAQIIGKLQPDQPAAEKAGRA